MKTPPKLTIWTAISVVIGCVIGSGVFVKPGRVLAASGDSNTALFAWLIGGLISLAGGLTLAEIASRIPKTGGIYVYVEELFGKSWGFVSGWLQSIIYGPALSSALSLYFASLLVQFLKISDESVKPIALITVFFLGGVSALSTSYGAFVQNVTTFAKLIPIALLGVFGLFMGQSPIFNVSLGSSEPAAGMGVAVLATLWAYDGWAQVSNMGGEIQNPSKNLPRAFLFGLAGVMLAYILINLSLFNVLTAERVLALNEKSAAVAAEQLFGETGGKFLGLGILISIFGCLNGNILTMPRVPFAMAQRGSFPFSRLIGAVHPKTNTPINSIALKTFLAVFMILLLNPDRITDIAMFIVYLCYSAVFLGVFILRKKLGAPLEGSYRVPLYPLMPLIASGGSLYVCYSMVTQQPWDALASLGVALSGLPIFFYLNRKGQANEVVEEKVLAIKYR